MNLRVQPVVKRLSVLTEYTTGFTETKEIAASRQSIALTLAKGSDEDVAKAVTKNDTVKRSCIANILNELSDQCSELCRLNNSSMLRSKTVCDIVSFKFGDFVNKELIKERASLLYQFLFTVACSKASSRNTVKTLEKKILAMAMAAGILLKARNKDMCMVQVVTSLLLHSGGLSEMVGNKLNIYMLWFNFNFPLFVCMVIYDSELKTKEKN